MNALDERTGGVDDLHTPLFQSLINIAADAVGADDDRLVRFRFFRRFNDPDAHFLKLVHHVAVVDDGAQGSYLLPCRCRLLHQLYGAADAEAEAGAFRYPDAHWATFFAMVSFMAAITSSMLISEVSTLMESRVIFRGATSRWVS